MEIFTFSGTGNSLHVARELALRLPDTSLIPIMGIVGKEEVNTRADVVGLVFPIHALTVPWPVRTFLEKADFGSASYIFAITTRECFAKVFDDIDHLLQQKGKTLDAGFSIEMPQNYIPIFETYTPEEIEGVEAAMLEDLAVVVQTITEQKTHRPKDPIWTFPLSHGLVPLVSRWFRKVRFPNMARSFYADDRCAGCGVCERICLSGKIRMVDGTPFWDQTVQCAYCFACLHYCPEEAIQIRGRRTEVKGRYHHPAITAVDIAAQKKSTRF
jgi:Pyruvate/2-oxoacid:ferredoxin oxidoreductase delta subunit